MGQSIQIVAKIWTEWPQIPSIRYSNYNNSQMPALEYQVKTLDHQLVTTGIINLGPLTTDHQIRNLVSNSTR